MILSDSGLGWNYYRMELLSDGTTIGWTYCVKMEVDSRFSFDELWRIASGSNQSFPTMVDEASRLDKITVQETVLEKHCTLTLMQSL